MEKREGIVGGMGLVGEKMMEKGGSVGGCYFVMMGKEEILGLV